MWKSPAAPLILRGILAIAVGIIALAWPGATALALVLIVGIWAFAGGFAEIFAAFRAGETAGTRALLILAGLVSLILGIVLCSRPDIGAVTIALLFGFFTLTHGAAQLATGVDLRRLAR